MKKQIEKMVAAMAACGVDQALIDQVVASVSEPAFFALPVVVDGVPRMTMAQARRFFDESFWPEYPRRDGRNPKEPACKKIVAAVLSGENPETIMAGVRRLAHGMRLRGKIGTPFVPQAITWINGKGWCDDDMGSPTPDPMPNGGGSPGFFGAAAAIRQRGEGGR